MIYLEKKSWVMFRAIFSNFSFKKKSLIKRNTKEFIYFFTVFLLLWLSSALWAIDYEDGRLRLTAVDKVGPMSEESDLVICQIPPEDTSVVSRQEREEAIRAKPSAPPGSAIAQYLLGVIEYNEGNVELARVWFQRAYESLEAEEGNVTAQKTQAFGRALDKSPPPATPAKVQFPEGYKVNVYYRDGWYIQPKNPSVGKKQVYSFLPGSTYKIRVEAENEQPAAVQRPLWLQSVTAERSEHKRINTGMKVIGALVMISWLMSR